MDVTRAGYPAPRRAPRHWDLWSLTARAVCAIGLVGGVLVWSVTGVVVASLSLVVLCWWLLLIVGVKGRRRGRLARRAGLGIAGSAGLVGAGGVAGIVLLLLVVVSSPFVRFVGRGSRGTAFASEAPDERRPTAPGRRVGGLADVETRSAAGRLAELRSRLPRSDRLVELDDSELCLAWRQSFVSLTATRDASSVLELVELRGQYLDELTRRHPTEIARWLASGARAAGNPMRFLAS